MKLLRKKKPITCARCEQSFRNWNALRKHSRSHLQSLAEMKLLQQGKIPEETKLGSGFKGKNKIIVS